MVRRVTTSLRAPVVIFTSALGFAACAGAPPPPEAPAPVPDVAPPTPPHPQKEMAVRSELGTIDDEATEGTFRRLELALQQCHRQGLRRVRYLGGDVEFFLRVGEDGSAKIAHLAQSTLGDRDTERCMMQLVQGATWPKPRGGDAEVHKKMGFDPPENVRRPPEGSPDKILEALHKQDKDVRQCKQSAKGAYFVTAYVVPARGKWGKIVAAGVSPPSPEGDAICDCLVKAVKALKVPTPGRSAVKVSFVL